VIDSIDVIAVLLVEDDEDDYLITREMLASQDRARFTVEWQADFDEALAAIHERRHDVYLIDYRLGARTGLDLVRAGFTHRPLAPVLILTGETNYEIDLEATALGVTDYLVKQELGPVSLERSIRYAIQHHRAIEDLARSEERYALAVRAANDGIWDWELGSNRIYFSPRWRAILGQPDEPHDEDPSVWFDLVHPDDLGRLRSAIEAHLEGHTRHLESQHRMRHANGSWRWVLTRGLAIRGVDGTASRMAGSLSDITEQHKAQSQLQHDALHDALTGLPNRALFADRAEQILQRASRDPAAGCAVLFVDIDRFKLVNDSLSHAVGDQLLIAFARRISMALRPGDTVARIGGDEFTILLDGVRSAAAALAITGRIQSELQRPFSVDGHTLFVTASIGIALSGPHTGPSELLRNADIAMYHAKREGRTRHALFDHSMHRRVVDRMSREHELRQAVEESLLGVHYQPIVDLGTGRIRGLEALVRWPEDWPVVEPQEFVPIAEEAGLIGSLGMHVLSTALEELAGWRRSGLVTPEVCISVNFSGAQLDEPALPADVRAALREAGLEGDALRLELTESTLLLDPDRVRETLSEICSTGAGLHLDDFGTGYSSLAVLHEFQVDALKIDRSFVASMTVEDGADAIVRSTVALAHSLGLDVIAEGIENPIQLRRLRALGCELGQGFLFSRPLDAAGIRGVLAAWSPAKAVALAERLTVA